jgi:hypothetical protein
LGAYWADSNVKEPGADANDPAALAAKLWEVSEQIIAELN